MQTVYKKPVINENTPIAAFDFDGTITVRDSLKDFALFSVGIYKASCAYLRSLPSALQWACGYRSRQDVKTVFMRCCWMGMEHSQLIRLATLYAAQRLPRLVRPEMLARIQAHKQLGHRLILVSASLDAYLKPWAFSVGFDAVLATELSFPNNQFQGTLATPNCWGPEKVKRLGAWLAEPDFRLQYAYGDSRGDSEMLARAEFPWLRDGKTVMPAL